jgi:thioredoxin reductase (NADPH)
MLMVYGSQAIYAARAVIVATGSTGRTDKLPGEQEFQGRGVCYCTACDGPLFAERDVIVIGDDGQAMQEAMALTRIARSVCVVRRSLKMPSGDELYEVLCSQENVHVESGLRLESIFGDDCVKGASFRDQDGSVRTLQADGIFLYLHGNAPATDFLEGAVAVDDAGYITTDELCRTNVPGVFAVGDVRSKQVRQMVVAAAEGCTAALAAERLIHKTTTMRVDRGR